MPFHFGLIGHNISYSLSPAIFARLFELSGEEGTFSLIDVDPDHLQAELASLRRLNGFSVTIPYKLEILPLLDDLTDDARSIGAVNSVKVDRGRLIGHNTDWRGFLLPLQHRFEEMRNILILGNGGAARAIICGLLWQNYNAGFTICGRDRSKAKILSDELTKSFSNPPALTPLEFAQIPDDGRFDLIVNCTPVGRGIYESMSPLPEAFSFSGQPICYDLIYSPNTTRFLADAERHNCPTINGIQMLIMQAVLSYTIWSGKKMDPHYLVKKIETAWSEIKEFDQ